MRRGCVRPLIRVSGSGVGFTSHLSRYDLFRSTFSVGLPWVRRVEGLITLKRVSLCVRYPCLLKTSRGTSLTKINLFSVHPYKFEFSRTVLFPLKPSFGYFPPSIEDSEFTFFDWVSGRSSGLSLGPFVCRSFTILPSLLWSFRSEFFTEVNLN